MEEVQTSRVTLVQNVSNEFYIRIARPIGEVDDFAEELQALMAAGEQDTVNLEIISPGGSLDTCIVLRRALHACKAKTRAWIGPTCASAATAIALACDEWEVDEMSAFMVHTGSFSTGHDKAREVHTAVAHNVRMIERFIRSVYAGFLTEDEIDRALDGRDLYFDGEELAERLERYATQRQADAETAFAEMHKVVDGPAEED